MMRKIVYGLMSVLILLVLTSYVFNWFPSPMESGYSHLMTFGKEGSAPGEFKAPLGIAINGEELFISDSGNNRIQVFDLNGSFLREFGKSGDKVGELGRPMHLDIFEDKLYVTEYLNDRIQIFSLLGDPLYMFGEPGLGEGQLDSPGGVAVGKDGKIFVAGFYNHTVQVFDKEGGFIKHYGTTGEKSFRSGRFKYPTDVALLSSGNIAIADAYNDRVQVLNYEGKVVNLWGGPFGMNMSGGFNGWFRTATSVTVDPNDNIFVADFFNHRIQKFNSDGTFLSVIGSQGIGKGAFDRPTDVAVDDKGNLYVVDFGNNRIQKFSKIVN